MKSTIMSLLLATILASSGYTLQLIEPSDDIAIACPQDWLLDDGSGEYPIHLMHDQHPAELLIFRTEISDTGAVDSEVELRESVLGIVDDVILPLPKAQLISSTGYSHGRSAGFVLDFTSVDSATATPLRHRLKAILYRHPDGHQLLFTLWGKSGTQVWEEVSGPIRQIQESFEYTGVAADAVFAGGEASPWRYALPVFLVVCLVVLLGIRGTKHDRPILASSHSFWRCSCGRLNPSRVNTCHRCGTAGQPVQVS
jgi:hypothetical protein